MVQLPATQLQDRETIFIELVSPLLLQEDANDPLYPYSPPSLAETICDLRRSTSPGSVRTLVLSVPFTHRDNNILDALVALSQLLASPVCNKLAALRIMGATYTLNDKRFLAACSGLSTVRLLDLLIAEPLDSYSLAAIVSAFEGINSLSIALPAATTIGLHKTFKEETQGTFRRLSQLSLDLQGSKQDFVGEMFGRGTLRGLRSLHVVFLQDWTEQLSHSLGAALSGDNSVIHSFAIDRKAGDTRGKKRSRLDGLEHCLPTSIAHLSFSTSRPDEAILLPPDFLSGRLPCLESLSLRFAYDGSPSGTLKAYSNALHTLPMLKDVTFEGFLSDQEAEIERDTQGARGTLAGHPFADDRAVTWQLLGMLAQDLEKLDIGHDLSLQSETRKEERTFVGRGQLSTA